MAGSGQWPGDPQGWGPPPGPVRDCAALVLDGVWPYELARPRPETAQIARDLDVDLREIVARTNEQLAQLVRLNLAPAEHRAAEERFIRVAKSMAVLRAESTVRQLGGRSILGTPGMPPLTAAPVQRPSRAGGEVTGEVSSEAVSAPLAVVRDQSGRPGRTPPPRSDVLGRHRAPDAPLRGYVGDERPDERAGQRGTSSPVSPAGEVVPERLTRNGLSDRPQSGPPSEGDRRGSVDGHQVPARPHAQPLAVQAPVSLQQMAGSLARQQPGLQWLVAERDDGRVVAVCDVLSGWIPVGIALPAGVTVLAPEKREGPMEDWVGPVTRSARYGPGNRIESRGAVAVAGDEVFSVVGVDDDLGERIGAATNRPGLPRITHTLARAAVGGGGVLAAELDVLNVHVETALQLVLGEYPHVNADEVASCMLMGAAAALVEQRMSLAAYHFGWYEAIADRR